MPMIAAHYGNFFSQYILNRLRPEVVSAMANEICTTVYTFVLDTPTNQKFVNAFKAKFKGELPEPESETYTGVQVMLKALQATGGDTTPEKLRQAILALDFEGIAARMRFDQQTHCVVRDIYVCKIGKVGDVWGLIPVYTYKDVPPLGH